MSEKISFTVASPAARMTLLESVALALQLAIALAVAGCQNLPKSATMAQTEPPAALAAQSERVTPVPIAEDHRPDLSDAQDPYRWLEKINSEKALNWARVQTAKAEATLVQDSRFPKMEQAYKEVLLAKDRIPAPRIRGPHIYNFWQDEQHVRGIWRRTSFAEYHRETPEWDTLLDVDALAVKENKNWVYRGVECLPQPSATRCLVKLSDGGKDAFTIREFDLKTKAFVDDGFKVAEAKNDIEWVDENTVFIGTDWGKGALTESGYPRTVKLWKRGEPLASAETIFEAEPKDIRASSEVIDRPEAKYIFLVREISFYENEYYVWRRPQKPVRLQVPADAEFKGVFRGEAFFLLRTAWNRTGESFRANTLITYRLGDPATPHVELVVSASGGGGKPADVSEDGAEGHSRRGKSRTKRRGHSQSKSDGISVVTEVVTTPRSVFINVLENVRSRIYLLERSKHGGWSRRRIKLPDFGSLDFVSADNQDEPMVIGYQSFLQPQTLYWFPFSDGKAKPQLLKRLPARFDASPYNVEQAWVTSRDPSGESAQIPYFVIRRRGEHKARPTLLTAYGGFEISSLPEYLGALGKAWLEPGGTYVLANIRGGGEFGPRWHQAAVGPLRQHAFQDFIAVAEDLVRRGITTSAQLAIQGGSNGGLLVTAAAVQRPQLFGAVSAAVPLTDMQHYSEWLAGASWIAEYGDPKDATQLATLLKYSPYQNLKSGVSYPPMFLTSSTRDDRVHPAHARKFAARLIELNQPVLYYENEEGGHAAAANIPQRIHKSALNLTFLWSTLAPEKKSSEAEARTESEAEKKSEDGKDPSQP